MFIHLLFSAQLSDELNDEVFFDFSPKPVRRKVKKDQAVLIDPMTSDLTDDDLKLRQAASLPTVVENETEIEPAARRERGVDEADSFIGWFWGEVYTNFSCLSFVISNSQTHLLELSLNQAVSIE